MRDGRLFLLPVSIGESPPEAVLPAETLRIARELGYFIVENAKSARAELKRIGIRRPIQDIDIRELPREPTSADLDALLAPLAQACSAGLMSEAGAPAVADPGARLVNVAHARGIVVVPLVGAWIALEAVGLEEAITRLGTLQTLGGAEPLRRMHLGLMHEIVGDNAEAKTIYDELAANPAELSLREVQIIGNFRQRQGDEAGARLLYDAYLESTGADLALEPSYAALEEGTSVDAVIANATDGIAESLFDIAFLLQRQQAVDTSLVLTRKAIYLKPDFAVAQIFLADTLAGDSRYEAAIDAYYKVPADSGFGWQARLEAARTLDFIERTDEAIAALKVMIDERPERSDAAQLLGTIFRGRERFEEAIPYYNIAVERIGEPTVADWPLLYFRGIVLERTKQWELAEADFLKALELEPEQPYVMNYLAYSWIEFGQNYDEALDMLKRAVELRPEDGYIVDSLGWVYYRLGDYENAVVQLERAVELTPLDPTINDHLGDAYWRVGRYAEARFQWRRALSFNPDEELRPLIEGKLERGLLEGDSAESQTGG